MFNMAQADSDYLVRVPISAALGTAIYICPDIDCDSWHIDSTMRASCLDFVHMENRIM